MRSLSKGLILQLLLFLSALLSGLTGVIAGDRAVERSQIERLGDAAAQHARSAAEPAAIREQAAYLAALPRIARASLPSFAIAVPRTVLRAIGIDTRRLE
ncbi:hypothetical protein KY084_00940 [Stakelama sp. CBK3Z-3]|uniref:Uncharacterized protein n=1 Tax=Stakelama flava TaxID=2860338 RepID=A0ABS6XHY6_9SPHN|nr:hypothetical protein [Stakelama flava]MBW4329443.1 hypothetical protein [Stakelama flava]